MAKSSKSYTLNGAITDLQGQALEGLTVRAYDLDPKTPENPLGQPALTDAQGKYSIPFAEEDFKIGGVESGGPDVFIRVYAGEELLGESGVTKNAGKNTRIDLKVRYEAVVPEDQGWLLSGRILDLNDLGLSGIVVKVYEKSLRREHLLGQVNSDAAGYYALPFSRAQLMQPDKSSVDLFLKAAAADGTLLGQSHVLFNAPAEATIDLVIDRSDLRGTPEFQRYLNALEPLLAESQLALKDLQAEDWEFALQVTGIPAEHLRYLQVATEFFEDLNEPWRISYALLRQGLPTDFAALYNRPLADLKAAYLASLEAHIVDSPSTEAAAIILGGLKNQAAQLPLPEPETLEATALDKPFLLQSEAVQAQALPKLKQFLDQQVLRYIPLASSALRKAIAQLPLDLSAHSAQDLPNYFQKVLLPALRKQTNLREELGGIRLRQFPAGKSIAELLRLDLALLVTLGVR
ncbi:MAG TPA: carboxypeptidase-like regulatory domain-containing protein, partial [Flavilitoribacter sp.]|nr:carboxypeptidase-like regulatory domain-containing protein [Flavilitoribacter sp.]